MSAVSVDAPPGYGEPIPGSYEVAAPKRIASQDHSAAITVRIVIFSLSLATNGSGFSCRCGSTDVAGGLTAPQAPPTRRGQLDDGLGSTNQ